MKLVLFAFVIAAVYALVLCVTASGLISSVQSLQQNYNHVAATADQWSAGDTSASFVPAK